MSVLSHGGGGGGGGAGHKYNVAAPGMMAGIGMSLLFHWWGGGGTKYPNTKIMILL